MEAVVLQIKPFTQPLKPMVTHYRLPLIGNHVEGIANAETAYEFDDLKGYSRLS